MQISLLLVKINTEYTSHYLLSENTLAHMPTKCPFSKTRQIGYYFIENYKMYHDHIFIQPTFITY